jgi:tRNA (cytidine/uridine-2'-O-)-methyltransferase
MEIVLVEPEIPQNTGNIARTCALTRTALNLIKPLGFSIDDRHLKRAGLDYWHLVNLKVWDSFGDFLEENKSAQLYLATTKANRSYHEVNYDPEGFLVFGRETRGLSDEILNAFPECTIRIPMLDIGRSLNLANSVAIILYESLRQNGFSGLR